jgi:hypothetical protein
MNSSIIIDHCTNDRLFGLITLSSLVHQLTDCTLADQLQGLLPDVRENAKLKWITFQVCILDLNETVNNLDE